MSDVLEDDQEIRVRIRGLNKSFGATHALKDVSIDFRAGRVHALLGANGCGKSTLVKILSGYHEPDSGEISPTGHAARERIAFVHQDLGLVPSLSIAENLGLTCGFTLSRGAIDWREEHRRAQKLLDEYGIATLASDAVASLGPAHQSMIAIARALNSLPESGGVLVLDEPTARLPISEVDHLLQMVRRVKARGVAILYITHRLEEVMQVADEVSVLRDGAIVFYGPTSAIDKEKLVTLIVNKAIRPLTARSATTARAAELLQVRGLSGIRLRQVDLTVGRGEVVGVAGLVGSGRSELGRLLFGLQKAQAGTIHLHDANITNLSTRALVEKGLAYVPQERRSGVFHGLGVAENAVLADFSALMSRIGIVSARVRRAADEVVRTMSVKTESISTPIENLSGGNQQKVSLGKWLRRDVQLLILDEPTQGIDIGARTEIFNTIREVVEAKKIGALVFDSDLDILVDFCDRVIVMCDGQVVGEYQGAQLTHEVINRAVYER
ncbi:sugar ABC transporter ATP-binding protein [Paraburkholderia rhynchosiae]|uniref:Galactose/methyl galactoside import ATP-binding protein MglA n=1 Tax=Paraburkholderia rhynchosiae TaxID=487049 RepID=A0A2N7WHB9_9BURK|nr:sugar ABC transporter ATP-binding protein [Paraburkholderia rhynchosiae]PMS28772.1 sugar ABC transporter ATP-binding protein [Paraburkholderia rhynchosiae]CAB3657078.1 Galactose/methyl galactoside import ATP-binding protein MglA [Paraburkholderia rhynchosiae]